MVNRSPEGSVHLDGIVAPKSQAGELIVRQMLDHFEQTRIGAEQVLPEVGSALHEIFLVLSVAHFTHAADQQAIAIILDEAVPVAAPDNFNDVPARAAKNGFQFLNNFAVAANRTVEALQVAVDDED